MALLTFGGLLVAGIVKILALVCSAVLPLLEPLIALGLWGSVGYFAYRYFRKKEKPKEEAPEISPELVRLQTTGTPLVVGNPFRGIFVVGAAGSGKSESIAVPLLSEFVRLGYSGFERGKAGVLRYTACVRNGHGKRHGTFGIVAEKPADRANDNEYL